MTWMKSKEQTSTIDYVITDKAITHLIQIANVRCLTSANTGSNHILVLFKLRMKMQIKLKHIPEYVEQINIESITLQHMNYIANTYNKKIKERARGSIE